MDMMTLDRKPKTPVRRPETPVDRLIAVFGIKRVAAIADLTTEAIRKWNRRSGAGGGGGLVPSAHQSKYLAAAREEGLALSEADLIGTPYQ